MKKKLLVALTIVLFTLCLYGCGCQHEWFDDATCTEPKTCPDCNETSGEPLGHLWIDATCTEPKTCSRCSLTEGETLPHTYKEIIFDATCIQEGFTHYICSVCEDSYKETIEPTGHIWEEATCDTPKQCSECGTCGEKLEFKEHDYVNGTCTYCGKKSNI